MERRDNSEFVRGQAHDTGPVLEARNSIAHTPKKQRSGDLSSECETFALTCPNKRALQTPPRRSNELVHLTRIPSLVQGLSFRIL